MRCLFGIPIVLHALVAVPFFVYGLILLIRRQRRKYGVILLLITLAFLFANNLAQYAFFRSGGIFSDLISSDRFKWCVENQWTAPDEKQK